MCIVCNGEQLQLPDGTDLMALLKVMGFQENSTVVWHNGRQVLFKEYHSLKLFDGDQLQLYPIIIGG